MRRPFSFVPAVTRKPRVTASREFSERMRKGRIRPCTQARRFEMNSLLRLSVAALALGAAVPLASAQTTIIERRAPAYVELTPAQRTVIYREVIRQRPVAVAPQVELRVGAPIPQAVELYPVPEEVYGE